MTVVGHRARGRDKDKDKDKDKDDRYIGSDMIA